MKKQITTLLFLILIQSVQKAQRILYNYKKRFLCVLYVLCVSSLFGYEAEDLYLSNWKTYTNTTYMHQICCKGDSIIGATWGGISIYNKTDSTFSTLVKSDGLSKNEVHSIHYIESLNQFWLGCYKEGISRYKNGEFLKPYQENQGVVGSYINDIDGNDRYIFLGTDEGLTMFEIMEDENPAFKKTFIYKEDGSGWLSHNNVNCIAFDDSNRIWVGTNQGIDYTKISYDEMILPDNWHHILEGEKITALDYCDGKIYIGTENGLGIIDSLDNVEPNIQFPVFEGNLPTPEISAILAPDDTTIWVAFGKWNETKQRYDNAKGVGRYNLLNSDDYQVWDEDDSLFNQISDIKMNECGNIWVASWGNGIYAFENDNWHNYKKNCIGSNFVSTLMIDSKQNLWCGSGYCKGSVRQGVKGVSVYNNILWKSYNKDNSKLVGNKSFCFTEDLQGRIWIGDWNRGITRITNYGDGTESWESITSSLHCDIPGIVDENTISFLECDIDGNVWIGDYNIGIKIVIPPNDSVYSFNPYTVTSHPFEQFDPVSVLIRPGKVLFGAYYSGIRFWEGQGFPETGECLIPAGNPKFEGPFMNIVIQELQYGDFIWTGGVDGLYMYDEYWGEWYKFTNSNVKEYYWSGGEWQRYLYYWIDEEGNQESRLGSGKSNQINAVFVDPHGRKWLATNGGGISMLDRDSYSFTNFNTENSDLCSDVVLSFAYNPYTGELFAGTSEGLCSFNIGANVKDESSSQPVEKLAVFPNPFKPAEHPYIYFQPYPNDKLPTGKNRLYIYNLAGELVMKLKESDQFRFCWDGKNKANKDVASGIYFYVLSSEFDDVHITGKFAVIR